MATLDDRQEIDALRAALREALDGQERARDTAVRLEQELAAAYALLGHAADGLRAEFGA
jgi:hypothetical protein